MKNKLKYILGLEKYTPYMDEYFEKSNAQSCIIVSIIISILEIWMILTSIINHITGARVRSAEWLITHLGAYFLLLGGALTLLFYSIRVIKEEKHNKTFGKILTTFFSLVCIIFGIYISYFDYKKGEQILTFITMEIFIIDLILWRPIVSFCIDTISFIAVYQIYAIAMPLTYASKVNLFIIWIAILLTGFNMYYQKYKDAKKDENIENINTYLKKLAITDELTDIPNIQSFKINASKSLKETFHRPDDFLFLFLDIQNFKNYNEKYGFEKGNNLLNAFGHLLMYSFEKAPIARFSDDHFVVLAKKDSAQSILEILRRKIELTDNEIKLGLKVGAYCPKNADININTACDYARYACNTIKKKFDKNYCEYSDKMNQDFERRKYIINNIDNAIKNNYIKVYYQPVAFTSSKKLCGFEALARWNDPIYGMIPPVNFIPILEEYREIQKLDSFVLQQVCKDIDELRSTNITPLPVSVNFSRIDFELLDVKKLIDENLQKYNLDNELIHIELTESALAESNQTLEDSLRQLNSSGFALWLDDFGSGYSGLNSLTQYNFKMMKIDMGFLKNFNSNKKTKSVLKNIVSMAKEIGMQTLTEGVESQEIVDFLESIGCDRIQGYLLGKPMPKEVIFEKLKNGDYQF
ncbi:MAG: bifunctional diguanylate cyclase/phosphodiesterase [Treponema sp.]|nr:bifunctional diguanylate cyclase/phosphodiesterase [Treponema sp.]